LVERTLLKSKGDAFDKLSFKGKNLNLAPVTEEHLQVAATADQHKVKVIGVIPRQILSNPLEATLKADHGSLQADLSQDVLKIAVFERHNNTGNHSVAFVKGFEIKSGAIATSINHDSHNIITIGSSDQLMVKAIARLKEIDGGIVVVDDKGNCEEIPLPIGGLMTNSDPSEVTQIIHRLKKITAAIGCKLEEPFLQLSFLALPVIPALKITDKGLVDVTQFKIVPVISE